MFTSKGGYILRKLTLDEALSNYLPHKSGSWESVHQSVFLTRDDQEKWYNSLPPNSYIFTAHPGIRNLSVGAIKITEIHPIHRSAWIGQDVWSTYRGQGYGKKIVEAGVEFCFNVLNLNRIQCEILENNVASQMNFQANGFVLEGKRRQAVYKPGGYQDSLMYGLLRNDYINSASLLPTP